MKSIKNNIVSVFLVLTVFLYGGQDISDFDFHFNYIIENTTSNTDSPDFNSVDSLLEDDVPIVSQRSFIQIANFDFKNLDSYFCLFPPKLSYSIWLPPEIS